MTRRIEGTIRRVEKEYAAELALADFIEFLDARWYRHAVYNRGDGVDFIRMSGALLSVFPAKERHPPAFPQKNATPRPSRKRTPPPGLPAKERHPRENGGGNPGAEWPD